MSGLGDRQRLALDLGRPAGEVAQVLGGERHVDALGELDRLAVVERLELGQLVRVRLDRVGERQHRARALGGGDPAPAPVLEGLARRADRAVDVLGARPAAPPRWRRPVDGSSVSKVRPSAALDALAADQQAVRSGGERAGGVGQGVRQG